MSRREEDPVRWTDAPSEDALERRAGELLKVPPPPPLGSVRRARIEMRLATGAGASPRLRLGYVAAAVVAALAVAGGVVAAVGSRRDRNADDDASLGDGERPAPHGRTVTGDSVPREEPAPTAPPATMAPSSEAAPRAHRPKTNVGGAALQHDPDEPPAPAAGVGPLSEPRLLADARARLQTGRDAQGALALVAEHRRRFPRGALALEARLTEVEALVSLGRRREALAVLELLSLDRLPRAAELGVLRAELRAEAGRHGEAIGDFTPCADGARCRPDPEERALYGRASCRERVGQRAGARADLERYLARFPRGRFASAVRAALDSH